jgi:hypothetical protein
LTTVLFKMVCWILLAICMANGAAPMAIILSATEKSGIRFLKRIVIKLLPVRK